MSSRPPSIVSYVSNDHSSQADAFHLSQQKRAECVVDAGDSISNVLNTELERTQTLLNRIVLAEVRDVLDGLIDEVIEEICTVGVKRKRMVYKAKQKVRIVSAMEKLKEELPSRTPKVALQQRIREAVGVSNLQLQSVEKWGTAGPNRKRGRKVDDDFEREILDQLVFTTLERVHNKEQASVVANVCYSHAVIVTAAKKVQSLPKWQEQEVIQKLKFRRTWIQGWLRRCALRKRRISTQIKKLPPPDEVQRQMAEIQKRVVDGDYSAAEVFSGDETGMLFGAPPLLQHIPVDADRATAPEGDDKARFTSFLYGSAAGIMEPSFNIVKCSSKNPFDLSGTRVVHNLHTTSFTAAKGWKLFTWARELMLPQKKGAPAMPTKCKRPYLIHNDGTVITVQNNAWMDSTGMALWCDTQIGPRMRERRSKTLMVWDNCGPHKVQAVRDVLAEWNIEVADLPPKMTDTLQVMDLAVNGPLKAAIRRHRTNELFEYFQEWKIRRLTAATRPGASLPEFSPPKPKLANGLEALFECLANSLATNDFKQSMQRTFVKVGLWKGRDNEFVVYRSHKKLGAVSMLPSTERAIAQELDSSNADGAELTTSFGEIAAEFECESRRDAEVESEEPGPSGEPVEVDESEE